MSLCKYHHNICKHTTHQQIKSNQKKKECTKQTAKACLEASELEIHKFLNWEYGFNLITVWKYSGFKREIQQMYKIYIDILGMQQFRGNS
jgi:hypothetical protein